MLSGQDFHNKDFAGIHSQTNTDMSVLFVREHFHLFLQLEQQTMGIHKFSVAGLVRRFKVILEVGETVNRNAFGWINYVVVLAELVQGGIVGLVGKQEMRILVSCVVAKLIVVEWQRIRELGSEVVDGLKDITPYLSELVKRRQVSESIVRLNVK